MLGKQVNAIPFPVRNFNNLGVSFQHTTMSNIYTYKYVLIFSLFDLEIWMLSYIWYTSCTSDSVLKYVECACGKWTCRVKAKLNSWEVWVE